MEPSSTSSRNVDAGADGAGSTRSPIVARNGLRVRVADLEGRAGAERAARCRWSSSRGTRPRRRSRRPASPRSPPSAPRRRARPRAPAALVLAQAISGSCSASWARATWSAPRSRAAARRDDRLQRRRGEMARPAAAPRARRSRRRSARRPGPRASRSGRPATDRTRHVGAAVEHADRGDLALASPRERARGRARAACPRTCRT